MKTKLWIFPLLALLMASLACSILSGGAQKPTSAPAESGGGKATLVPAQEAVEPTQPAAGNYQTEFPLPGTVTNFTDLGSGAINFQTDLSLTDAIAFYREAFAAAGYTEREITTAITDSTFSLVFDGHASGKAIVLQGVDLGGNTNVNLRFEDI